MAMKPSMMLLPRLLAFTVTLFLFIGFFFEPVSCIETDDFPYSDHCSLTVPEATPDNQTYKSFGPFNEVEIGYYYSGSGNRILPSSITRFLNSFSFETKSVYRTDRDGVFKIESNLILQSPYYVGNLPYGAGVSSRSPLNLRLKGFWSVSSGMLCMVGGGFAYSKEGKLLAPAAVLKLKNVKQFSNITTLVTGTLVSLSDDRDYFEPISLLVVPQFGYNYTFVPEEFGDSGEIGDGVRGLPYSLHPRQGFCKIISINGNVFSLQYASGCSPEKNCLPFGGLVGDLPSAMSLKRLGYCSDFQRKVHLLIEFHSANQVGYYRPFNPNSTLVGEGFWDDTKNQLRVFVCRILDIGESWSSASVGDCTTRLALKFPGKLSLRKAGRIVGQIWTNKTANDSDYFNTIVLQSTENRVERIPGLKYEYTEKERVAKLCPIKKPAKSKGERYPNAYNSPDMSFGLSVKIFEGKIGWGSASPLFVGDQFYNQYWYMGGAATSSMPLSTTQGGPVKISYKMSIFLRPAPELDGGAVPYNQTRENMGITAEGIYDTDTGALCMVGCREVVSNNQVVPNASLDCEVLLNFQFPPVNLNKNGGYIKGSIKSTRQSSDPLYFNPLTVSSAVFSVEQAKKSIWTMALEIIMVLISSTLVCVFLRLQLYHVKKNPEVLSFISLLMLAILTLGYMIPLVQNFEALFSKKQGQQNSVLVHGAGWLELNGVIIRIITVVAFLMQFRLFQLALSARLENQTGIGLWFAEKMTLLVTLSVYAAGAFIVMLVKWGKHRPEAVLLSNSQQYSTWQDLKSYAGLILDGFLLPQILLNIFSNSRENTLSFSFYAGTTFIRLLPHVYDLYSNQSYVQQKGRYIFVNPTEDFFSTSWDVCISLIVLFFAVLIYLQQKFGGRCIVPGRFRELKAYELVPVTGES